jgi:hypothetical protein
MQSPAGQTIVQTGHHLIGGKTTLPSRRFAFIKHNSLSKTVRLMY